MNVLSPPPPFFLKQAAPAFGVKGVVKSGLIKMPELDGKVWDQKPPQLETKGATT